MDTLINNFDERGIEAENLNLATRQKYALSTQFIDRLEESGKINSNVKLRLKDILEHTEGNPKEGETTESMKKEFKRLKIAENREEPFAVKETKTYYTKDEYNQSRYND